jgi:hypothetical protein
MAVSMPRASGKRASQNPLYSAWTRTLAETVFPVSRPAREAPAWDAA